MSAIRFDTLQYANTLKEVGVNPKQAEVFAKLQSDILKNADNHLSTKQDLILLEQRLTIKLGIMLVIALGLFSGIIKLMIG